MGAVEGIRDSSVAGVRTSAVPMWVKLMTGKPKPELVKPPPAMMKLAGGEARSIGLGVMELTPRVSLTVSEMRSEEQTAVLPAYLYIFCRTSPAIKPGWDPPRLVASV